jgi:formate dehydrogenase major subunit
LFRGIDMVEKGCTIEFTLDGRPVLAQQNETIWDVAKREGIDIPHLCHSNKPSYRSDGNCRACMVEIEGERVLAASCIRHPLQGAIVHTASERTKKARKTVFEMLVTDQPPREEAYDKSSSFWLWAEKIGVSQSRFPRIESERTPTEDCSHVAMKVNLDACIQCNLCTRACRDVQVNDVIGLAHRGRESKIVFDFDDLMGSSSCVACGECVQACPTGALMPQSLVPSEVINDSSAVDDTIDTICPYCGVGCQISYAVKDNNIIFAKGRNGPSNENRLCVKGRFGFDYTTHKHRLKTPLIRKKGVPKNIGIDPGNPLEHFREATWDEALDLTAEGFRKLHQKHGGESIAGFGSAKCSNEEAYLFQKFIRVAFGHNNVDHCTRLCHASSVAALMESVGSGAVTAAFNEIKNADCAIIIGANSVQKRNIRARSELQDVFSIFAQAVTARIHDNKSSTTFCELFEIRCCYGMIFS